MAENELLIHINGDPEGFNQATNEASTKAKDLENALGAIAKVSAVAFAGLTGAIAATVAEFGEAERGQNQLNAVLQSTQFAAGLTAKEINAIAASLQSTTTFTDDAILASSNLLLTFKDIGGETFPRAQQAIADVATAMKTDLQSATIQVGKALNDPVQGISALTRVGIQFTEQQKALIQGFVEVGDKAQAQAIILEELESQFAGQAAAAAQGVGVFIQLKNVFGELAETIGAILAPPLVAAAGQLKALIEFANANEPLVRFIAISIAAGAAITGFVAGLSGLGLAIINLPPLLAAVNVAITGTTTAVRGLVGATGLGLVLIAIPLVIQNFAAIRDFMTGPLFAAFQFMQTAIQEFVAFAISPFKALALAIQGDFGGAVEQLKITLLGVPGILFKAGTDAYKAFQDGQQIGRQSQRQIEQAELAKQGEFSVNISKIQEQAAIDAKNRADELKEKLISTADDKGIQLTNIEALMADDLLAIDEALGNGQVDIFRSTSDQLIAEANARADALRAAESSSSGGGGVSSSSAPSTPGNTGRDVLGVLAEDSEAGRAARRALGPNVYNPLTGRNDLKDWLARALGPKFAQGFSGVMRGRDSIPGRFSPGEIIVPETFSQGLRKGRFALVGPGFGRGGMGSQVNVNFVSREAQRVITAETTKARNLGTFRGSR